MNPFAVRKFIIGGIIVLVISIYIIRLFYIQIIDETYKFSADNNSQRYVIQYPSRGLIFDRNNKLLVCNKAAYDLMLNRQELKPFDTAELANIIGIEKDQLKRILIRIKNNQEYVFKPAPFLNQLSDSVYAILQEKLYKFPGFFVQPRTLRKYTTKLAAHLFGYVGEVDSSIIKRNAYYQMGDYIGMSGIEKAYEKELRGKKGVTIYLVDVHSRIKGSFQSGRMDTSAVFGRNLISTIDADIQEYGEKLMSNFKGSIVAIEPSSGEILAFVSSPDYDPQLLVGRERSKNFNILKQNIQLPLFNRAIMPKYPPGSTFKLMNALIGLKEGVINKETMFSCLPGYVAGIIHVGCHIHPTPLDLPHSIQHSCNAYYCNVFRRIMENPAFPSQADSYNGWRKLLMTFGLGQKLNTDLPNELSGNIPLAGYYNKIYGRNHWISLTVISLAIGQGEVGVTPLQMANMVAAVANRGYYFIPHTVKSIQGIDTIDSRFKTKNFTAFDSALFTPIIDGMFMAVNGPDGGTAAIAAVPGLDICGKTGTAQNPHGQEDHSIFIAFAPKNNPKIALSVYIENGGFGSTYAAPIASLLIEKYLTDSVKRTWLEEYLLNARIDYSKYEKKH
jgi:penicillin-binding protein 2